MAVSPSPSSESDDPFPIGSVLDDRYRIEAVLGTGGMGRVYRAEHTEDGRAVAIKVLHDELTRNREASQRFKREMVASRLLGHPNIVEVSDTGVLDTGACYLVMEVLEGESLGDRLGRDRRLHWVEALDILRGVLNGLRHAHDNGVVHRDVKPDNIYLTHRDGALVIKILDFGIAKLLAGSAEDPASTRAGLTVGTPAYLSPEQAVGGEITPASDMYSASIVLYEMLAGRAPFEDKDPLAMLGAHVSRPPPRFADVAPGVEIPPALEDIVQHGLRKAPADRIRTAGEYLALLDAFSAPLLPASWTSLGPSSVNPAPAVALAPTVVAHTATPLPGATPAPGSPWRGPLPRAARAVSIADVDEPIPLTWILRSGVVIGLVFIAAIALAIAAHCGAADRAATPPPGTRAESGSSAGAGARPEAAAGEAEAKPDPAESGSRAAAPAGEPVPTRPAAKPAPPVKHAPPARAHRP